MCFQGNDLLQALYVGLKFLIIGTSANVDLSIKHSIVNFQSPPPVLFYSREEILLLFLDLAHLSQKKTSKCFESHYSPCKIGHFLLGAMGFPLWLSW